MSTIGIGVGVISFIIPLLILAVIIVAIVKHSKNPDSKNDFEKNIRTIYVYIITIIFLFAMVFSSIQIFNSTLNFVLPEKQIEISNYNEDGRQINVRNSYLVDLATSIAVFIVSVPMFIRHSKHAKEL